MFFQKPHMTPRSDEFSIVEKAERIARSVETPQQCVVAENYISRARRLCAEGESFARLDDFVGYMRVRCRDLALELQDAR